jgi:hypothetical protein
MSGFLQNKKVNIKQCISKIKSCISSDVYGIDYTNGVHHIRPSLNCKSLIFCDNVILWSINTDHRVYIQKQCQQYFGKSFELKIIRSDILKQNDIRPAGTIYYCFKISLYSTGDGRFYTVSKPSIYGHKPIWYGVQP